METIEERFWSKVDKTNLDGCWIWKAACAGASGYGNFYVDKKRGYMSAHRFSYILLKGEITNGMLVCHSCGNSKCINPNHLFLGSHKEKSIHRQNKRRSNINENKYLNCKTCGLKKSKKDFYWRQKTSYRTECKACYSITNRIKKYGVSHETYTTMLESQNNVCAICYKKPEETLSVDHDHITKIIRGLLCQRCNKALGLFKDSIESLKSAANYLEKTTKS